MAGVREGPIEDLNLSVRAYNCLRRSGYSRIEQVVSASDEELLGIRNLGRRCLDEIREAISGDWSPWRSSADDDPNDWDWRGDDGGLGSRVPRRPSPGSLDAWAIAPEPPT